MKNEENLTVDMPSKNLKCLNCKFGLIVNPYRTKCGKYPDGKPYDIYFNCPFFEKAILRKENN